MLFFSMFLGFYSGFWISLGVCTLLFLLLVYSWCRLGFTCTDLDFLYLDYSFLFGKGGWGGNGIVGWGVPCSLV